MGEADEERALKREADQERVMKREIDPKRDADQERAKRIAHQVSSRHRQRSQPASFQRLWLCACCVHGITR